MIKMGYTRECVNCKYSRGGGSDVWCNHNPKGKETYMVETDCPYFEGNKYYKGPQTLTIKAELSDEEEEQLKKEFNRITKDKENWAFIADCSVQVMNEEEKYKEDYLRIATNDLKKMQEENEQLRQKNQRLHQTLENIQKELNKYNNEWVEL